MNEPPIASPFGPEDETDSVGGLFGAPLPLKILVGIELGRVVLTCILAFFKYQWSSLTFTFWSLNAIFLLLCIFLLLGSKICWWVIQLWAIPGVLCRIADAAIYRGGYRPISQLYPDVLSWLFLAQEFVLFVYLFTPQARRFFFGRAKSKFR